MKRSLKSRYHLLITILLGIVVLQAMLMLISLSTSTNLRDLVSDMQSIIIIFTFVIFVYVVVIYNYIPYRLRKTFKEVGGIIEDISHGKYNIDIDSSTHDQDSDIQELILALQRMLNILFRFDQVKSDKIFEHHQRIQQLINMMKQSVLITSISGDIIYCNDSIRRRWTMISERVNLNELIFKHDFNERIFSTMTDALRFGNSLVDVGFEDAEGKQSALINGSIIRNRKGAATGSVFIVDIRDNAKQN
ncbi:MAG: hypothetical protein Q8M98_05810 [Candidatus Cloacimonadaceae bacterium]|nr:hypothetical protein [Candidatus Cloacimonadaceae bacterium]MDP3114278.1 hypothetical protein [Candidatus Cloacimonadaceae bacterium]